MAEEVKNELSTSEVKLEAPKMLNGKEVNDIKIRCSRHGDISQGSIYLRYSTIQESTKTIINQNNIMCMCCLNELYTKLQKTPKKITDISYKKDENGKLILDENGNPIQIVKERVLYLKDKEGNLILDENGNPVPEYEIGEPTVEVIYKDEPKNGEEVKAEAPKDAPKNGDEVTW
jgi:virulence-associated protein VapD